MKPFSVGGLAVLLKTLDYYFTWFLKTLKLTQYVFYQPTFFVSDVPDSIPFIILVERTEVYKDVPKLESQNVSQTL